MIISYYENDEQISYSSSFAQSMLSPSPSPSPYMDSSSPLIYYLPITTTIAMTSSINECDYKEAKDNVIYNLQSSHKIYVEAWNGVGATALLQEVAKEVESEKKSKFDFDTVIKVVWPAPFQNLREIQRAVAKQLNLSPSVTDILDAKDEDDDFWNVEFSSRDKDWSVAINQAVRDRKVLLIFYNNIANDKLIDPNELGIPIGGPWDRNKVLWTTGGKNISSIEAASASADLRLIRMKPKNKAEALDLVYKEAAEIASYIEESSGAEIASYIEESNGGSLQTAQILVVRCFWYCLLLCRAFNRSELLDDRPLEAVKYFVCEEILRGDAAWEIGSALAPLIGPIIKYQLQNWSTLTLPRWAKKELLPLKTLFIYYITQGDWLKSSLPSEEESYRWISIRSPQDNNPEPWDFFKKYGSSDMSKVSSFFGLFEKKTHQALPDGFFDRFSNIRVLDLLGCIGKPLSSCLTSGCSISKSKSTLNFCQGACQWQSTLIARDYNI